MSTDPAMTVVTALIRPRMEGRVVEALHALPEFPGFFISEVRGQGRGRGAGGSYLANEFDLTYHHFLQLQIVCRADIAGQVSGRGRERGLDRKQRRRRDLQRAGAFIRAHPRNRWAAGRGFAMIDALLAFSIRQRWLVMVVVAAHRRSRRLEFHAPADRCRARHHQCAGADQHHGRRATRRSRSSSASPSRSRPRWVGCRISNTRARCRAMGLSQVTVVFKDGTDIYFARQLVNERIQQVKDQLPPGIETAMGPISTGLGEIYMFSVEAKQGAATPGNAQPSCAPSRTGSSSRSCARCPAWSRSTRSAATRSSSTSCPIRRG